MTYESQVVYRDPTCTDTERFGIDVLSVTPPEHDGRVYGVISITHGARFQDGLDNEGQRQSVCVKPGDELRMLAALGDKLRGVREGDPNLNNSTLVVTASRLKEIAMRCGLTEAQAMRLCRLAAKPVR